METNRRKGEEGNKGNKLTFYCVGRLGCLRLMLVAACDDIDDFCHSGRRHRLTRLALPSGAILAFTLQVHLPYMQPPSLANCRQKCCYHARRGRWPQPDGLTGGSREFEKSRAFLCCLCFLRSTALPVSRPHCWPRRSTDFSPSSCTDQTTD